MSFHRILIAVDGEPLAAHAAELGIELASSLGAEIAFVHAIEPGLVAGSGDNALPRRAYVAFIGCQPLIFIAMQHARRWRDPHVICEESQSLGNMSLVPPGFGEGGWGFFDSHEKKTPPCPTPKPEGKRSAEPRKLVAT